MFQPLATADFEAIVRDMEEVVQRHRVRQRHDRRDAPTTATASAGWCCAASDFDDLVVGINAVSSALEAGGYGERVLCAVFAFEDHASARCTGSTTTSAAPSIRSCPRGGDQQRDNERELVLKAQIGAELPVEPELERWFPLWGIPI